MATFTAVNDGDWRNPATWDLAASYPQDGDTVVLGGHIVTLSHNDACTDFSYTGGTLNINGFMLAVSGTMTVSSGTGFNLSGGGTVRAAHFDDTAGSITGVLGGGTLHVLNSLTIAGGTYTNGTILSDSDLTINTAGGSGSLAFQSATSVILGYSGTIAAVSITANNAMTINSGCTLPISIPIYVTSGSLNVVGTWGVSDSEIQSPLTSISNGVSVVAGAIIQGILTINNLWSITGGQIGGDNSIITVTGSPGTFSNSGGTLTLKGTWKLYAATTINPNAGALSDMNGWAMNVYPQVRSATLSLFGKMAVYPSAAYDGGYAAGANGAGGGGIWPTAAQL